MNLIMSLPQKINLDAILNFNVFLGPFGGELFVSTAWCLADFWAQLD